MKVEVEVEGGTGEKVPLARGPIPLRPKSTIGYAKCKLHYCPVPKGYWCLVQMRETLVKDFVWSGSGVSARATGFWTADFFFSSSNTCAEVDHNVALCERTINRPGLRTLFHL